MSGKALQSPFRMSTAHTPLFHPRHRVAVFWPVGEGLFRLLTAEGLSTSGLQLPDGRPQLHSLADQKGGPPFPVAQPLDQHGGTPDHHGRTDQGRAGVKLTLSELS